MICRAFFPCNLSRGLNYQSLAEKSSEIKHKNLAFRNECLFCWDFSNSDTAVVLYFYLYYNNFHYLCLYLLIYLYNINNKIIDKKIPYCLFYVGVTKKKHIWEKCWYSCTYLVYQNMTWKIHRICIRKVDLCAWFNLKHHGEGAHLRAKMRTTASSWSNRTTFMGCQCH